MTIYFRFILDFKMASDIVFRHLLVDSIPKRSIRIFKRNLMKRHVFHPSICPESITILQEFQKMLFCVNPGYSPGILKSSVKFNMGQLILKISRYIGQLMPRKTSGKNIHKLGKLHERIRADSWASTPVRNRREFGNTPGRCLARFLGVCEDF